MKLVVLDKTVAIIMALGLLALFFMLLGIINNASGTLVAQNESLQEQKKELEKSYKKLNDNYKNSIAALSNAVDARDPYTSGHSVRVADISVKIGKALGMSKDKINELELAALFHDIGKIGIPDNVLLKPGKLSESEYKIIKSHPQIGASILKDIDYLENILPMIIHHHEKYSGGGYPSGLKGDDIPLESRIIALSDSYDAMTSDRPYRRGMSHESAISEIIKHKGIQFDPSIVDAFMEIETTVRR
jgi:putative nucleotidyltransferase with HDIG domain